MNSYLNVFIDKEYPSFIDKYLNTKTLNRLKHITQFCGCDYTDLYNPRFKLTRYSHSLVVAHIVWHFTHNKKETIAALFHDVGTPCFAHTIDLLFNDSINQESSERNIVDIMNEDKELIKLFKEDGIDINDLDDLSKYPILENKSPKLCADRLDGVLHTCYIWLHTHSLKEIKEVYNDLIVLTNEDGKKEIGFQTEEIALKFVKMVYTYAMVLQSNTDKYVMNYISDIIRKAAKDKLLSIDDLYNKKEIEIVRILRKNYPSWNIFSKSTKVSDSSIKPNNYYISFDTKKRNVIPLIKPNIRIIDNNIEAKEIYNQIQLYKSEKYGFIKELKKL